MCPEFEQPTCLATVSVDLDGKATYDFLIDGTATFAFSPSWLPNPALHKPCALHIGTLGTIIEPGAGAILNWAGAAGTQGIPIVFDPNIRPSVVSEREIYRKSVESFVQISAVVKASDDDVNWLYPDTELIDVARSWLQSQATHLVVITKGAEGLMSVTQSGDGAEGYQVIYEPAVKITVKDTVGAGDTVGAVLVEGVVQHGIEKLANNQACLRGVMKRANCASAITCSREGCKPPTPADLA
eukprot:TRINITY_DN44419_c0_g1_i2.p1 TRINITY_DN44419_c0_g1~~TRINITY_DN44419_c0_g1_i2.p1  ORF type:complete len:242 (+),score=31.29 TRINITY_DN44419_c0_g1_i2:441-1166(+)